MISLIICGADPGKISAVAHAYRRILGSEPWELIHISDARSMAEGCNRGAARSRGDILLFSRDDVEVLSADLPQRLYAHLARFDLIDVAGTSRVVNAGWWGAGYPHVFGQAAWLQSNGRLMVYLYGAPRPVVANIQALDDLFIAARRSVLDKVTFDEATFDGWHLHGMDFSYHAYRAGLRLAVANDINLLYPGGVYDDVWRSYADRFHGKWLTQAVLRSTPQYQTAFVEVDSRAQAMKVMAPRFWWNP